MNSKTYVDLRNTFMSKLDENTVSFLFSGTPVRKSADATYVFQANRNYRYLTGIEEESSILVIDNVKKETILFIRDIDPFKEKWMGYFIQPEVAKIISGIEDVRFFSEFEAYFNEQLNRDVQIGVDFDHDVISEDFLAGPLSLIDHVEDESRLVDLFPILTSCRMIKHPDEVKAIEKALVVTNDAIESALTQLKPGNNENDVAALFQYEGMLQGGDLMFDTIMASGANAVVLHYVSNNAPLVDGEMVLFDLGIRVNGYGADISRTYPINGVFSERQALVYQAVLDCFHVINEAAKPGVSLLDLNEIAKDNLAKSLINMGLIDSAEDVGEYYYHSIGHSLGLDTHDVWNGRDHLLEAGHVITNEPGLYIKEWEIGVRIETDLLITQTGARDLAPFIKREIKDIETLLGK